MMEDVILSKTESICPECFTTIPAWRVARDDRVYLRKTCPKHGRLESVVWRGHPACSSWVKPKIPSYPEAPSTPVKKGCPLDCGLCAEHRQHTCTALIEVTQRCNLRCSVCFADAGNHRGRPDLGKHCGTIRPAPCRCRSMQRATLGRRADPARRSAGNSCPGASAGISLHSNQHERPASGKRHFLPGGPERCGSCVSLSSVRRHGRLDLPKASRAGVVSRKAACH